MTQLVLLVMAAAWLAVLIPPMLRSRVENRPNSSVTDFRRQLNMLQNTATPPRGAVRAMGRPLAQSPLSRPAAAGRPNQPVLRSGVTRHPTESELAVQRSNTVTMPSSPRSFDGAGETPRYRSHGDPTGGRQRPGSTSRGDVRPARNERRASHDAPPRPEGARRSHGDPTGGLRRPGDETGEIKRRRSNILFFLVVSTACTLFLAATTSSDVMLYLFAMAFLSLCGYVYLLAQQNGQSPQRRNPSLRDGWADSY